MATTELQKLRQTLQTDRLIKIYVGEKTPETKPFLVPQSSLEQTTEYFCKAFRNEHLGTNSESGTLDFPEDDIGAWEVFLYWVIKHSLPSSEELVPAVADEVFTDAKGDVYNTTLKDCTLAVCCWVLGDKYNIPAFQDEVMLELLRSLELNSVELKSVKEAFERTPPGSKLRELMAEEIAVSLSVGLLKYEAIDILDGVVGFASDLARKLVEIDLRPSDVHRLPYTKLNGWQDRDAWRKFMVGDGPKQHWIHEKK